MKKHIVVTLFIAIFAAIAVPRDVQEARDLLLKTAAVLINAAAALHQHALDPYDAGAAEADGQSPLQDAGLRAGVLLHAAEWRHFRGRQMPKGRGCRVSHCENRWDDDLDRPFRRCYWRCPRPAPLAPQQDQSTPPVYRAEPQEPRQYGAHAPQLNLPHIPAEVVFVISGLIALLILGAAAQHFGRIRLTRETDEALREAAAAAAAKVKLDAAVAEADAIIRTYRARASN